MEMVRREGPFRESFQLYSTRRCEDTPIAGEQGVGGGVEQVDTERDRHGEQHRMAAAEHVYGTFDGDLTTTGKNHFQQFSIASFLHQRTGAADWMDGERMLGHQLR